MADFKQKLLDMQQELSERVSKIDNDLHSRKTSSKFSDQVVDRQNDDVLLNLKEEAQQELEQISQALVKVENGRYGICEKCHGDISPDRLSAVPFAALCVNCAG